MAPPSRRARSGGRGVLLPLPLDAVYEILLRLTARELCRLRAVSRPWRALLSDPQFIAAHAARHPGPLIVAGYGLSSGYPDGNILCEIMDLSGRVVKRIRAAGDRTGNDSVLLTQLGFVQIVRGMSSYRLLDPATGAVYALPDELADEHAAHQADIYEYRAGVVFGKVASTGEYKALCVFDNTFDEPSSEQLCEVFTLFDGSSSHARWRAKRAPPYHVDVRLNYVAVVNGIVYFFFSEGYWYPYVKQKFIASFDLEAEEWRETLQGPLFRFEGSAPGLPSSDTNFNHVSLASLNDCLAVVHCAYSSYIDIWFLVDFEKGLWVRQHSIQLKPNAPDDGFLLYPLLVLNDGRIVTYAAKRGLLSVYNPRTTDYTDLAVTRPYVAMDLYTGNLLSLPNGAS